ncbi:Hpt domain-containing protein [Ottowia sp. SB7-C50]|uniref:hybrid sensor histidine kinase/response regulator n=1 Tax=Ottowia sp. SB7-C50 TaxID=3081231 RepID=UPI002954954E|nr:Hpt domain-containing protein [Ottowia sp. SB7-C50]WOP16253.1 Hpt domain-containing protein [Ottowia sp. SB7-C50]
MSQSAEHSATDGAPATDLGPLAWVLDESRKSIESASRAIKRFAHDAEAARGVDLTSIDASTLRVARQQLHQVVGALEMVGQSVPAQMVRAMEGAAQRFVTHPEQCTESAAQTLERAGFALIEYLDAQLGERPRPALGLFPQFKQVQEMAGADRIHPADLSTVPWRWIDPVVPAAAHPLAYSPEVRGRLDQRVLKLMKHDDLNAASELSMISLGLAQGESARQPAIFWKLSAGFFEALGQALIPVDLYAKRAASRVLLQFASLARGDQGVSERLAHDLLFFCGQAAPSAPSDAPALAGVRKAWSLDREPPARYDESTFGLYDPSLLVQARRRIEQVKENWSVLAGGDLTRMKACVDQFGLVAESLEKLHEQGRPLAEVLNQTAEHIAQSGKAPHPELAMEMATAVLFLEASFADFRPGDPAFATRMRQLAQRLDSVREGAVAPPLEPWMEDLYRRVSDRQTMGTVVGELRVTLSQVEQHLDQFFRHPADTGPLAPVPGLMGQMRGVLSVLGLDQAATAVGHMRDAVSEFLLQDADVEPARAAGTFERLGNSLGALGFQIDMLAYQPMLARRLFVYDAAAGELRHVSGRLGGSAVAVPPAFDTGTVDMALDIDDVPPEVKPSTELPDTTQPHAAMLGQLDQIATRAALDEKPQLAQVAQRAAEAARARDTAELTGALEALEATASVPVTAPEPTAATAPGDDDLQDDDLLDIFLDEAREVVQGGSEAIEALGSEPGDMAQQTALRRAFHTLKGSSRMVGLAQFGEAAWSMERMMNAWLADEKPVTEDVRSLAADAMRGFDAWVQDIATHGSSDWSAEPFSVAADALRLEGRRLPLRWGPDDATNVLTEQVGYVDAFPASRLDAPGVTDAPQALASFDLPDLELDGAELTDTPVDDEVVSAVPDEVPVAEAIEMFEWDLSDAELSTDSDLALPEVVELDATTLSLAPEPAAEVVALALDAATFADFPDLALPPPPAAPDHRPTEAEPLQLLSHSPAAHDIAAPQASTEATAEPPAVAPPPVSDAADGDALAAGDADLYRQIGDLRISTPLYNVYLNEADEWSRQLITELSEWALELDQPVPERAIARAHSLAGSSATVGFVALSDLARAVEHALQRLHGQPRGTPEQAKVLSDAAEDIRRVLHQFAAGMLKAPHADTLAAVQALEPTQPADSVAAPAQPDGTTTAIFDIAQPRPAPAIAESAVPDTAPRARSIADDIDVTDAVDPDLFPIFEEEAEELLPQLGTALRQWVAHPDQREARAQVLRVLHTLKGSARLAGALRLGEMAHRTESEIEAIGSEQQIGSADLAPLLDHLDELEGGLRHLQSAGEAAPLSATAGVPQAAAELPVPAPEDAASPAADVAAAHQAGVARGDVALPAPLVLTSARAAASQAVRVRSQLLDRLVSQAGEVVTSRARLETEMSQLRGSLGDLTGNLERLRGQLRDVELQAETQMQSRLALSKDTQQGFDPLEFDRFTRMQELTRMMAESVNDVATVQRSLQRAVEASEDDLAAQARQSRELQRDLLRTRMVEFEGLSERLYRVVRYVSKETGKPVRLDIAGGSIEMDRGILERMVPAFEHLLRNCVVHGIEPQSARVDSGKDAVGQIQIDVQQSGNDVSVEFRDDGAGLNLARIRERALQSGLIQADQPLTDAETANLVFLPGLTTATEITELAGRGVGMDVVRSEVQALGGRIETQTRPGHGTSFRLVLPLTTAVTHVVMLRAGSLAVGVPSNLVEIVQRASAADLQQAYGSGTYRYGDEPLPFIWAGALLQSSARSVEPPGRTTPVVIFRSADQRVAVHVDEVLGNQEVVVKSLGPQLSRLPGLVAITALASGAVALIYNPVVLAAIYGAEARALGARASDAPAPERAGDADAPAAPVAFTAASDIPLVLVVDDSITVRRVTQRLLQREGYRVALAADGLQGLEKLQGERPVVVLSDIEMPRMDGFDFVRNIRADSQLSDLPVIMITSRIAEKHREHARDLGVDHYLGKPYAEDELLGLIKGYVRARAGRAAV